MPNHLTQQQLHDLETTERIASCFSLVGTSFIMFTFLYSDTFRKPVNRLIFYASWGNTLCNIATLMSQAPVRAGGDSHLCQFQGFLIQFFLPADALWNLAMAINVYLTIFRKYKPEHLKSIEWKYHIMCYGMPFFVAFIYLFISTADKGKIYGPATLWCWVDVEWGVLRIALLYGPAWFCIIVSLCIYILAGQEIFHKRRQLRVFNTKISRDSEIENPFTDYKTTRIQITREPALGSWPELALIHMPEERTPTRARTPSITPEYVPYSATIISKPMSPEIEHMKRTTRRTSAQYGKGSPALHAKTAAWGYTRIALLFFVSLLVTWLPSSINRVYSLIHPDRVSLPFTYASGVVLPLMGFWNAIIYIVSSWTAVKALFMGRLSLDIPIQKSVSSHTRSTSLLHSHASTEQNHDSMERFVHRSSIV